MEEAAVRELVELVKTAGPTLWDAGRHAANALFWQAIAWIIFWFGIAGITFFGNARTDSGNEYPIRVGIAFLFAALGMTGVDVLIEAIVAPDYVAIQKLVSLVS